MKKMPVVALIGQTNAGKSSILNRMAHRNIAIVAREEGTTRDNVVAKIDDSFILVDTAGLKDPTDDFEASIQDQIQDAVESADVILVTLDSAKYPDYRDKDITKNALRSRKPVFLVLNKSDLGESLPDGEFLSLGVKPTETFRVSATTGQGISALKTRIVSATAFSRAASARPVGLRPFASQGASATGERRSSSPCQAPDSLEKAIADTDEPHLKLALIGRPNVGKSSLFNSLAKKQQAVVSSRQGTTRDVNRVEIRYKGQTIEILDTAGLRKPGKREVGIEKFSAIRTLAAIEEADICALLVDATEPHSKLDQSLAGQIVEAGKGIVVVLTKSDLIKNQSEDSSTSFARARLHGAHSLQTASEPSGTRSQNLQIDSDEPEAGSKNSRFDSILDKLEYDFNFLPYAPVVITSSETGENVTRLFELALEIDENRHQQVKTADLNKILNDAILSHAPAGLKNTRPKPKYIVQTDVCPPWFVVHGHDLGLLHWSWKRFLERKIREKYPFVGTPIMFSYRNDKNDKNPD